MFRGGCKSVLRLPKRFNRLDWVLSRGFVRFQPLRESQLPPSFRNSKPIATNALTEEEKQRLSRVIKQAEEQQKKQQQQQQQQQQELQHQIDNDQVIVMQRSWYSNPLFRIFLLFVPCLVVGVGYAIYETANDRPVFFPLYMNSAVPLEKAHGFENVDVELLKIVSKETLTKRLNMNQTIREHLGLPLVLGDYENFQVSVQYNTLAFEGIELDFRKCWYWPDISFREIQAPSLPSNFNKFIKPIRVAEGGDEDTDDIELDSVFKEEHDYNLKIRGTINVVDEKLHRIEPGTAKITFDGEVNFDHTRLVRITSALMHYKNQKGNGSGGTIQKLW